MRGILLALCLLVILCVSATPRKSPVIKIPPRPTVRTNVLHSPKGLEQVKSLQKRKVLSIRFAAVQPPQTGSVILNWTSCGGSTEIKWGTNSGVYTSSVIVSGVTNYTVTNLIVGMTYYFASSTNCLDTFGTTEWRYTVPAANPPPMLRYPLYAQFGTNLNSISDISTNPFAWTTNTGNGFYRIRTGAGVP
jgi:YHS domain-containing protein